MKLSLPMRVTIANALASAVWITICVLFMGDMKIQGLVAVSGAVLIAAGVTICICELY